MEVFEEPYEFIIIDNTIKAVSDKMFHSNAKDFIQNKMTPLQLMELMYGCDKKRKPEKETSNLRVTKSSKTRRSNTTAPTAGTSSNE